MKQIETVIDMINEKIAPFDQKIEKYEYGLTNQTYFVFYSTAKTSTSKMQATYAEDELYLFKLILTKITENEDLSIGPLDALNLCNQLPQKINKKRGEALLDGWIRSCYFYKHTDNQIYLGAKLLTEFKDTLQAMELNYLKSCLLCETIAVWVRKSAG